MATYEIEQYEIWSRKFRVEADSEAEAIHKLHCGEAVAVENSLKYLELASDYGLSAEDNEDISEGLRALGERIDSVIPAIHRIKVVESSMANHAYNLNLDGPRLRAQREFLLRLVEPSTPGPPCLYSPTDREALEGLIALTDALADQAHDQYGLDCLLDDLELCDCQEPGEFCSGIPGILARLEHGRLVAGTKVECCGMCERYPTDQAALDHLVALGIAPPPTPTPA